MSQIPRDKQNDQNAWEESIVEYLEAHPDFFLHHSDVLPMLKLRHPVHGNVVSLLEYQVQMLRQQNHDVKMQLHDLVDVARENDVLAGRLQAFTVAMINAASLDDVLDVSQDILRKEFKVDSVKMMLQCKEADCYRPELVPPKDRRFDLLYKQFKGGKPLCGGKYADTTLKYLFGEQAKKIRSNALIPLNQKTMKGILCLGSFDPQRFHLKMGTVFLSYLSEVLSAAVLRYR